VRLPNDFAEAHWLLDYRFGFVKRGLVGTFVSLLTASVGTRPTARLIAFLSIAAFAVFCAVMLAIAIRILARSQWSVTSVLTVLVFLTSPFMVMSAHLVGYYDNIIVLLTVASLTALIKGHPWSGAAIQAVAVLVHESSLLLGFPVFCLAWLVMRIEGRQRPAPLALVPLLLPPLAFGTIVLAGNILRPAELQQLFTARLSEFPFIQDNRNTLVPWWLTITFAEYYALEAPRFVERLSSPQMLWLMLPSVLGILGFVVLTFRSRVVWAGVIGALAVCAIPQLLHAVAVDTPRIWTYAILESYLVMWVYSELLRQRSKRALALGPLLLLALATNILSRTPLMDREIDRVNVSTGVLVCAAAVGALVLSLRSSRQVAAYNEQGAGK
jgi:hypothetical protein